MLQSNACSFNSRRGAALCLGCAGTLKEVIPSYLLYINKIFKVGITVLLKTIRVLLFLRHLLCSGSLRVKEGFWEEQ